MMYPYIPHPKPDASESIGDAAENLATVLAEELGMRRVKSRAELDDGCFIIASSPFHLLLITTLDDRPFTCLLVNKIAENKDVHMHVLGGASVSVNQLRKAARVPGSKLRRERKTFGDKVWRVNKEKHGIEVSFEAKPSDSILALLKGVGFRYGKSGIWWAKDTPEIRKAVTDMGLSERPAA